MARWQSGHAAACKAVYAGSIPTLASTSPFSTLPSVRPVPSGTGAGILVSRHEARAVHFNTGKVFVRHVLSHAEYDRGQWKRQEGIQ